jgi:hypothetical protein
MTAGDTGTTSALCTLGGNTQNMVPYNFGEIDLSGNVTTHYINVSNHSEHTVTFVIADISNNAVMRLEGSNDGTNWCNLDATDYPVTDNGTYKIACTVPITYIRVNFVSRSTALIGKITDIAYFGR